MNKLSLLVLLLLLVCGLLSAEANTFILKETAVVSDNIIRIKDIALMDSPTRTRIGDLVVGISPELGLSSSIGRQEIFEKLVGNGIQSPRMEGAVRVKVLRKGVRVQPSFFKDKILAYIRKNSKWKDGITVEVKSNKDIMIPESGVRWQLTPANGQDFFGSVLFKLRAISNETNEEIYSNWLAANLKIVKKVAITNSRLTKNQPITLGDIRWETREITVFTKDALFDANQIAGQRAGRIIQPNTVITARLLQKQFLVRRGANATLVAKLRAIKATSTVKVLSNGALGDSVRVMNTASKKILAAVVTGKNTLEVVVE